MSFLMVKLLLPYVVGVAETVAQEPGAGGEGFPGGTFAGGLIHTFAGDQVVHFDLLQNIQAMANPAAQKAVGNAEYPRMGRMRAADFRNITAGKAVLIFDLPDPDSAYSANSRSSLTAKINFESNVPYFGLISTCFKKIYD